MKFDDAPDQAMYKIDAKSWLLFSETVYDAKYDSFVESLDSDIKIDAGISDEMFRLPGDADTAAAPVPRAERPRSNARSR